MIYPKFKTLTNMGKLDRVIRTIIGTTLLYFGLITQTLTDSTLVNVVSGIFGLTNLVSVAFKICPGYLLVGFSTLKTKNTQSNETLYKKAKEQAAINDSYHPKESSHRSFKRKLLLSITLPIALVLIIFSYLAFEQAKTNKLNNETEAARAVARMALNIEMSDNVSVIDHASQGVAAIIFHDGNGIRLPSVIENMPTDSDTAENMLSQLANTSNETAEVFTIGDRTMIKVTDSLPLSGLYVSVFYDTLEDKSYSLGPLFTRLAFTALLATWLSGWAAYYVINRYTAYATNNLKAEKYRNTHDVLTGLPNRSGLEEIIEKRVQTANAHSDSTSPDPFALLIIDMANFHYFNDSLGHQLGDELLKNMGSKLQDLTNPDESLVRLNGDVFCIVTPAGYKAEQAHTRASNIHTLLCKPMMFQDIQIDLQCRIGVASYPEHTSEGLDLLRLGVIALEHAKVRNKKVSIYDASKNTHSVKKLTIVTGILSAIENDQLYLAYQPKIDVLSGQLRGVEALIRWEHPIYKNVSPIEFIGWAEKSGLINPLTQWVLNEAEQQCRLWRNQGYDIPIAINLSPVNLQEQSVLDAIKSSVTKGYFVDGMLELEITENAVVQESKQALMQIKELHGLGVPISIDDFGTGLASFSYLRNFPVSNLKIDRSFVNIDDPDCHDQILLRSMIELGHNLNCVVTAEGVENEETLSLLKSLGCDYAQGYHICRPTSPVGVIDWLNINNISVCETENKHNLRHVA